MILQIGIPNIKQGIGPKKAWKLIENKDELKQLLKEDALCCESFKRNKQLISMNEIPRAVHDLILEEYNQNKYLKGKSCEN